MSHAPPAIQTTQQRQEVATAEQSASTDDGTAKHSSSTDDETPSSSEVHAVRTPQPLATNGSSPYPNALAPNGTVNVAPPQESMVLGDADILAIKRLSTRVNVLPIISRADTLTNERLEEMKSIIRRDLKKGGFHSSSILGQLDNNTEDEDEDDEGGEEDADEEEEEPRVPRTVVRIRPTRGSSDQLKRRSSFSRRSRSRTRAALTDEDVDAELNDVIFPKGVRSLRALFPFTVMSPDPVPSITSTNANGDAKSGVPFPLSSPPSAYRRRSVVLDAGDHLKDLRGKYTRNYRWGSVDVLSEFR